MIAAFAVQAVNLRTGVFQRAPTRSVGTSDGQDVYLASALAGSLASTLASTPTGTLVSTLVDMWSGRPV